LRDIIGKYNAPPSAAKGLEGHLITRVPDPDKPIAMRATLLFIGMDRTEQELGSPSGSPSASWKQTAVDATTAASKPTSSTEEKALGIWPSFDLLIEKSLWGFFVVLCICTYKNKDYDNNEQFRLVSW
jgi:hypothetical protein